MQKQLRYIRTCTSRHLQPLSSCRTHSARFQQPFSSSWSAIEKFNFNSFKISAWTISTNVQDPNRRTSSLQRGPLPCHRKSRCTLNAGRFQFSSPSSSARRRNAFHIYQRSPPSWCAWPVNINIDINIVSLQYTRNILLATSATALKASSGAIESCAHCS